MDNVEQVGVHVSLETPETFLLVKETLTRLGVISNKTKTLYQSAHILHKRGEYYIVHFKDLFILDGKQANISEDDVGRRNRIAKLLEDWGLVKILDRTQIEHISPPSAVKILSYKDKGSWSLVAKYSIGTKGHTA